MDNGKEFTRQILAEMVKMAKQIFAKITVQEDGTFTAYELWKCKGAMGNILHIDWNGTEHDRYAATVGTFKFEFAAHEVFETVYKFEKLCNVKQSDKIRFTYGNAENEIISEKAMYYTGNYERTYGGEIIGEGNYKVVTRKTTLKKLSEKVAEDKKSRIFYKCNGIWYNVSNGNGETVIGTIKRNPNYLMDSLPKYDFSIKNEWTVIYQALFNALKSERVNNTQEEREYENEPENTVICNKTNGGITKLSENIGKDKDSRVYVRIKNTWYRLVGFGGHDAKSISEKGANELLYLKSILEDMKNGESGICEQNDKILSMLSENYPPEPYNNSKCNKVNRHGKIPAQKYTPKKGICNTSNCKSDDLYWPKYRPICDHAKKLANSWGNRCLMLPYYLQQKVFPSELFYARRKISRFKPRYFVGYINYHLRKENALERKINGNTSVYKVLIRSET